MEKDDCEDRGYSQHWRLSKEDPICDKQPVSESKGISICSARKSYQRHPMVSVSHPPVGPPILRPRVMEMLMIALQLARSLLGTTSE